MIARMPIGPAAPWGWLGWGALWLATKHVRDMAHGGMPIFMLEMIYVVAL
jgi:hypothetical protein